jgi:thermitase
MNSFRRFGQLILIIGLTLIPALIPVRAQSDSHADLEYVPGEVLARLANVSDRDAVAGAFGLTVKAQFGAQPIYQMTINDDSAPEQKAAAMRSDSRVIYAEPNYLSAAPESQRRGGGSWAIGEGDETYTVQWAPTTVRLPEAHAVSRGAGVIVAVLDTGVDPDHPALAGRLLPGYDFVGVDADPIEEIGSSYGHGTHVAGIIALTAPNAMILPIRVLDAEGEGNIWVLAEALDYAVKNGADVINLSLGTLRRTELLDELIRAVTCADDDDDDHDDDDDDDDHDDDDDDGNNDDDDCDDDNNDPNSGRGQGVVVVAAAGNSGDSTPQYPAAEGVRGSLAVAASNRSDELAPFATRGPWVNLAAPGEQIISSVPLASGSAYGVWSGSSMAAPLVAGTVALVRAVEPQLSAVAVADRLVTNSATICAAVPRLDAAHTLGLPAQPPGYCTVHLPLLGGN